MTSAELKTIRESLGLPVSWLAERANVAERTVRFWESGRNQVPDDVAVLIANLDARVNLAVAESLSVVDKVARKNGKPEKVVLLRYHTDADLHHHRPDLAGMPTTFHACIVARLRGQLMARGIETKIVYMDLSEYMAWLDGKPDTESARTEWAASV